MKKILYFILALSLTGPTFSQGFTVAGGTTFSVNSGTSFGVTGNINNNSGGTINNSGLINLTGNWVDSGTTSGPGSFQFGGASVETVSGTSSPAFSNLDLVNSSGLTLATNVTVSDSLNFVSGVISTGNFTLSLAAGGLVSGAGPATYVNGNLQKYFSGGISSASFEIGDATYYTPISLAFNGGATSAGSITAYTTDGQHPQIATSGISSSNDVNRYWTLASNISGFTSFSPTFNFNASDILAGSNYTDFVVRQYSSSSWSALSTLLENPTSTSASGAIALAGDYAVGDSVSLLVTSNPSNSAVCPGSAASFSASASGTPVPTVQWQRSTGSGYVNIDGSTDGGVYTGYTSNTLNISNSTGLNGYTYQAVFTNINGAVTTSVATLTSSNPSAPVISETDITCNGLNNGVVNITSPSTGGTSPYTYSIDGTNYYSTSSFTGLSANSYSVIGKDANGCVSSSSNAVTVNNPGVLTTPTISETDITCHGLNNGQVTISVASTGGTGAIQYSLNGGAYQSGTTFTGLPANSYTVVAEDANLCQSGTSNSVSVSNPAALSIAPTGGTYSTGQTIDLTANASGGTGLATYTYSWSGPLSYNSGNVSSDPTTISNAATDMSGTYDVTVTDQNSCSTSGTAIVTVIGSGESIWTGTNSTDWNDAGNWTGGVPSSGCTASVVIPHVSNEPVLSGNYSLGSVEVDAGADFEVDAILNVCGAWTGGNGALGLVTGSGVVKLDGSSAQTIAGETQFQELVIDNSAGVSLGGGAAVSIMSALDLDTGNIDVSSGTLTFRSISTSQCAIIDNFSNTYGIYSGSITGNIHAQRYYAASLTYDQHFMGSPVNSPLLSQLGAGGSSGFVIPTNNCSETQVAGNSPFGNVYKLVESNGASCGMAQWYVEPGSAAAVNGQGYSVREPGSGTLTLVGGANLANSYQLTGLTNGNWSNTTAQGHTLSSGWQLLTNPYLATLQINSLNMEGEIDNQVQIWNTDGPYAGSYQPELIGDDAIIPPFQAFMIKYNVAGGNSGTATLNAADRVLAGQAFFEQNDNQLDILATNSGNGLVDKTIVAFNSNATDGFDKQFDADKIPGDFERQTLFSENNNKWMSINVLNSVTTTSTVPVGFEPGTDGNYTFNFNGVNTFDPTTYIYLEDVQTGTMTDVRTGGYSFKANSTDNWNRFILHFTPPAVISSKDAGCNSSGSISIIQPGIANWSYQLKDNNNAIIATGILNAGNSVNVSAQAGTYTLTLVDNNNYTVTKTVVVSGAQDITASFNAPSTTAPVQTDIAFISTSQNASNLYWNFGDGSVLTGIANPTHIYTQPGTYVVTLTVTSATGCSSSVSQSLNITGTATGLNNINSNHISMWSNANRLYVDFTAAGRVDAVVRIFDILGQEISNEKYTSNSIYQKNLDQVDAAYVIVSVINDDKITTRKLFIVNTQ